MAAFGGQGLGESGIRRAVLSEEEIYGIIAAEVVEAISKLFGSFKTALIEDFDCHYSVVTQVVVVAATIAFTIAGSWRWMAM